jgi:Tfp pilus assembly protein PilF
MKRISTPFLKNILYIIGITFVVLYIYHQTSSFDFINFDDPIYVSDNQAVKSGINYESLAWAFRIHKDICMYYQPIAWISHMIDVELWGLDPGRHHLSSVFIHLLNALLLFFILKSMTGSFIKSALAASLFSLHPVNVDAVSWIAERKTLVSSFFWFLGMWAYLLYVRKPKLSLYLLLLFFFTFGILTKPVMITFPCALLLLDIWPLNRIDFEKTFNFKILAHLIIEKIPLFIITGLWFITPLLSPALMSNETTPEFIPHSLRIANALVAYVKYVMKFFVPVDLSILYPYPESVPVIQAVSAFFMLFFVTSLFILQYKKKPYLIIGWLWFLGILFPTSGLILGTLWPSMADRWAYLPYIGLCIITSWFVVDIAMYRRNLLLIFLVLIGTYISWLTWTAKKQVTHWTNSLTIFEKSLTVIDYHYLPHQNIAAELMKRGVHEQARKHLSIIIEHEPDHAEAFYNMGLSFYQTGENEKSLNYLKKARAIDTKNANSYLVSVLILKKQKKYEEAINLCEQAFEKVRKKDEILYQFAQLMSDTGKNEVAELKLIELLSEAPHHVSGIILYADLLRQRNETDKALFHYQKALFLSPKNDKALMGISLCKKL